MSRQQSVFQQVEHIYQQSTREMAHWMWQNHVQWVATKAESLAQKYNADTEKVYVSALLHDLGDAWYERTDPQFDPRTEAESKTILQTAGFTPEEITEILDQIIEPHSCHPDNLPQTIEGKCLATADGMYHLISDFFPQFAWKKHPRGKTYQQWIEWVTEKIHRDYTTKIFFPDERDEVEPHYQALKLVYTLDN